MKLFHKDKGFTLIELIVVIGIFTLLSTVIILSGGDFNNAIVLQNMAYSVALSVREAQVYGLSVSDFNEDFGLAHGIAFNLDFADQYRLFADLDENKRWSNNNENIEIFTFTRNHKIDRLCATTPSGYSCVYDVIDITFIRPNPDATMFASTPGGSWPVSSAEIYIVSPEGQQKMVVVNSTGQISVQNP